MSDPHLKQTFDICCRTWPDIMEPWIIRLDGLHGDELVSGMRMALAQTIRQRFPNSKADAAVDARLGRNVEAAE